MQDCSVFQADLLQHASDTDALMLLMLQCIYSIPVDTDAADAAGAA